ncbi:MAG: sigma-70 family RNA polymerase sigma factor [Elusimicrobiota bacterium]|jgi:RNA polymerase sigma-70 factor (ECF subfamily)|nr:sigma-70 family RNA polymerase sigma factor [Elusimicrobiota bacterium]
MMKNCEDSELISKFKDGDNKAFEEIVLRYQAQLYTYVISMVKNPETANDILQDIFIRIFKNLPKYSEENKLKHWIFIIAKNMTMDFFRRDKTRRALPLETQEDDEMSILDTMPDKTPHPLEVIITNDRKELVRKAISNLSVEERELIYLKDSFTFKEIAEMQNKPIGTLLSKFNRSLQKVKKIISEKEPEAYNEECMR